MTSVGVWRLPVLTSQDYWSARSFKTNFEECLRLNARTTNTMLLDEAFYHQHPLRNVLAEVETSSSCTITS